MIGDKCFKASSHQTWFYFLFCSENTASSADCRLLLVAQQHSGLGLDSNIEAHSWRLQGWHWNGQRVCASWWYLSFMHRAPPNHCSYKLWLCAGYHSQGLLGRLVLILSLACCRRCLYLSHLGFCTLLTLTFLTHLIVLANSSSVCSLLTLSPNCVFIVYFAPMDTPCWSFLLSLHILSRTISKYVDLGILSTYVPSQGKLISSCLTYCLHQKLSDFIFGFSISSVTEPYTKLYL